jgi:glycosyltransferase involved in cell wall biosynthesis
MIDRLEYAFWKPPKKFDVILSHGHKTLSTVHWPHQKRIHFAHGIPPGPFGIPPHDEFSNYNIFETIQRLNREFLRLRLEFGFKRADIVITNSKYTQEWVESHVGISVDGNINPPVNLESFANERPPSGDFYLSMGGLYRYKNVRGIVDAFNNLDYRLKIAGTGPLEAELKQMAGENIEFVGFVEGKKKQRLLGKCRGFIQNSPFGIAPMEALASGAPVIGVDQRKFRYPTMPPPAYPIDIVREGINGILYSPSKSNENLKNAIRKAEQIDWDHDSIPDSVSNFDYKSTKEKIQQYL